MRPDIARFGTIPLLALLCLGLCLGLPSRAGARKADPDGLRPSTARLLDACFDDYCELDFPRAEAAVRAAMARQPRLPLPALYLQAELAAQIQELARAHVPLGAATARFAAASRRALALERSWEASRHDTRGLLYQGDSLGAEGLVALLAGDFWSAYHDGKSAYEILGLVRRRDPSLAADADLGLGEYVYDCGREPGFLRALLGLPGDVPGGIALLETCAKDASPRTAVLARLELSGILTEQAPDFVHALPYVRYALERYPQNWTNERDALEEARGLGLDRPEARALVEAVAGLWDRGGWRPPKYAGLDPAPLRLALARWFLAHGRRGAALRQLRALKAGSGPAAREAARLERGSRGRRGR